MLSLVNYGSSDSENDITDDEEPQPQLPTTQDGLHRLEIDDFLQETSTIKLPMPLVHKLEIAEEDDEFLHKKAVPSAVPPKKDKVKIMIPRLSDFKDDDDDEKTVIKVQTANKKSGLLGMLPRPSQSFAPAPRPTQRFKPDKLDQINTTEQPKKVGLIPYALMSHKPKAPETNSSTEKKEDSDDDEDEPVGSFFTFDSKDDELPKVSEDEVRALVAKESERLEQRKRQHDESQLGITNEQLSDQYHEQQELLNQRNADAEAVKALTGGNRAKRSKIDGIQIIDLSAAEVLPNRDEWLRKTLAGETSYMPTGNIVDKGPTALSKRKHQISYLSMRAESNEAELEAMWASNRQNKRETKSKYGF